LAFDGRRRYLITVHAAVRELLHLDERKRETEGRGRRSRIISAMMRTQRWLTAGNEDYRR